MKNRDFSQQVQTSPAFCTEGIMRYAWRQVNQINSVLSLSSGQVGGPSQFPKRQAVAWHKPSLARPDSTSPDSIPHRPLAIHH